VKVAYTMMNTGLLNIKSISLSEKGENSTDNLNGYRRTVGEPLNLNEKKRGEVDQTTDTRMCINVKMIKLKKNQGKDNFFSMTKD
jgi:hypothetical protein